MSAGTVVAILAVFWIVLIVGSIAAALAAATRRNRPVPSRRTTAPVWWLAAPTPSAHLHRRVVRSSRGVQRARAMRRRKGAPTVLDEMAARFEDHAVELDDRIALATTLPRRDRRSELTAEVARAKARLARLTGDPDADVSGDPPVIEVDGPTLRAGLAAGEGERPPGDTVPPVGCRAAHAAHRRGACAARPSPPPTHAATPARSLSAVLPLAFPAT